MVKEEVKRYLQEGKTHGVTTDVLKKKLLDNGFSEHDINEAVWELENAAKHETAPDTTSPAQDTPTTEGAKKKEGTENKKEEEKTTTDSGKIQTGMKMTKKEDMKAHVHDIDHHVQKKGGATGFFEKIGLAFGKPTQLFKTTNTEGAYPVLMHYLKLMIIPFIILSVVAAMYSIEIVDFFTKLVQGLSPELKDISLFEIGGIAATFIIIAFTAAFLFVASPLVLFSVAGILHVFVLLYKGKKGYTATLRSIAYSSTVILLLFWITIIPTTGKYLTIVLGLWFLTLCFIGTATTHEISKKRTLLILLTQIIVITGIVYGVTLL